MISWISRALEHPDETHSIPITKHCKLNLRHLSDNFYLSLIYGDVIEIERL